jgi:UDPglucose 6-dehydrogenase
MNNKIKNKKITVLGATFKANTDDMRESSSLVLIPYLLKKGGVVKYYDPSGPKSEFKKNKNLKFEKTLPKACLGADLIIINTEWDEFKSIDFKKMVKKSNFKIYDMRNLYNPSELRKKNIKYYSVGR